MWQNPTEFGLFADFIRSREPEHILEIGSFYGGTLYEWAQLLPELLVSIDLIVPEGWPQHEGVLAARATWREWMPGAVEFHDIQGDSSDERIIGECDDALSGRLFDFAFIDGDHTYEGVRADYDNYSPFVREGGIIAFHDTIENGSRNEPGVRRLVGELKWQHPSIEFFSPDWGAGICAFVV